MAVPHSRVLRAPRHQRGARPDRDARDHTARVARRARGATDLDEFPARAAASSARASRCSSWWRPLSLPGWHRRLMVGPVRLARDPGAQRGRDRPDPSRFYGWAYGVPVLVCPTVLTTVTWAALHPNAARPYIRPETVTAERDARREVAVGTVRIATAGMLLALAGASRLMAAPDRLKPGDHRPERRRSLRGRLAIRGGRRSRGLVRTGPRDHRVRSAPARRQPPPPYGNPRAVRESRTEDRRGGGAVTTHPILSATDEGSPTMDIYRQAPRGLIVSGQLGANERLPTVRQTASDLGVAPGTAAKAYKMLEQDGLVVSRTAAGTRVAESAAVLPRSVIRRIRELVDEAHRNGRRPSRRDQRPPCRMANRPRHNQPARRQPTSPPAKSRALVPSGASSHTRTHTLTNGAQP